jgi:hypothetical protein
MDRRVGLVLHGLVEPAKTVHTREVGREPAYEIRELRLAAAAEIERPSRDP